MNNNTKINFTPGPTSRFSLICLSFSATWSGVNVRIDRSPLKQVTTDPIKMKKILHRILAYNTHYKNPKLYHEVTPNVGPLRMTLKEP